MAEYVPAYHATTEALWLRETLYSIGLHSPGSTIPLLGDNVAAQSLSKNYSVHQRTKHLSSKYHLVRRATQKGSIELVDISTNDNTSDIFTKPLGSTLFLKHRAGLGMC